MGDWLDLKTHNNLHYVYVPEKSGAVKFRVRASNDAQIALTNGPFDRTPITEICIGGWSNTKSAIRRDHRKPYKAEAMTPRILHRNRYISFWMQWHGHKVAVGLDNEPAFLQYLDPEPHPITHFAVRTGFGAEGDWQIEVSPLLFRSPRMKPITTGQLRWVPKTIEEKVPEDALICGHEDGEVLYVGRANRGGSLIVGKYVPSQKCTVVGIYRHLTQHSTCEILCGYNGSWVKTHSDVIPPHAFEGGFEHAGMPYYVGRARIKGNLIPGKVLPPHKLCYVPYADTEVDNSSFEILVIQEKLPRTVIWSKLTNSDHDEYEDGNSEYDGFEDYMS